MKIFGFAGWSGSGKTTLIEQLIPRFVERGLKVSLIKHAHHSFDVDHPGRDSYRHREAGCSEVVVVSEKRWVIMHELRGEPEPSLEEQIKRVSPCWPAAWSSVASASYNCITQIGTGMVNAVRITSRMRGRSISPSPAFSAI